MTYSIISEAQPLQTDEQKQIEEVTQVEQKRTFTISELKGEIENIEKNIEDLTSRKAELEAKITAVVADLDLKLEAVAK